MDEREKHLNRLMLAEQQFRLACTVNLAVTNGVQTLDVPVEWVFGRHRVSYEDFGLRPGQAEFAASQLETTATFVIAGAIRDTLIALFPNPKESKNPDVVAAYQISRMIRNAFGHSMLTPKWSIDGDCKNRTFAINKIISLDTTGLHDAAMDWRHYGGPLAIFYFGRFVREELLNDKIDPNRRKPQLPTTQCYQQGRLVLRRIDELPDGLIEVARAGPGESIDLGGGHRLQVGPKQEA
jgi:hypothetical protein